MKLLVQLRVTTIDNGDSPEITLEYNKECLLNRDIDYAIDDIETILCDKKSVPYAYTDIPLGETERKQHDENGNPFPF